MSSPAAGRYSEVLLVEITARNSARYIQRPMVLANTQGHIGDVTDGAPRRIMTSFGGARKSSQME